jgi:hypothetical protein
MARKEEILLVHSTKFYELIESTKTLTERDLNKLFGVLTIPQF